MQINKITKDPKALKTIILFLPTLMALNEGIELEKKISSLGYAHPQLIMNNSFFVKLGKQKDLPEFLKQKLDLEEQVINWYEDNLGKLNNSIPHIFEEKAKDIVEKMTPFMEELL